MENNDKRTTDAHLEGGRNMPVSLKIIAGTILAIGGVYYLWTQHRAHVLEYWPLAIFLLCPFMHLFGHKGHGHHKGVDLNSEEYKGGNHG